MSIAVLRAGSCADLIGGDKMPRDIPVGNGTLLFTFDHQYQIRDLYFPHVGQENHAGAGPCRFGVYTDVPGRARMRSCAGPATPGGTSASAIFATR